MSLLLHLIILVVIYCLQRNLLPLIVIGTLINALIIISVQTYHSYWAYAVALCSPTIVVFTRHPLVTDLKLLIPFVAVGNATLVFMYAGVQESAMKVLWVGWSKAVVICVGGSWMLSFIRLRRDVQDRLKFIIRIQFVTSVAGVLMGNKIAEKLLQV